MPAVPMISDMPLPPTEPFGTDELVASGKVLYNQNCSGCHGGDARGNNLLPDLRFSGFTATEEAWNNIVIGGSLIEKGMISFEQRVDADEAEAIRAFVVSQAHQ